MMSKFPDFAGPNLISNAQTDRQISIVNYLSDAVSGYNVMVDTSLPCLGVRVCHIQLLSSTAKPVLAVTSIKQQPVISNHVPTC